MTDNKIENQNVEAQKYQWDQRTEEKAEDLKKNVNTTNQLNESWKKLWILRRETFVERKWNKIYYKIDAVNNYLKEISTSNKKIKEALLKDRKTIVTAIQIALYKSSSDYLPVWWIDWQRWPITRGAVAKFQNENWLEWQKNPWYLNVQTINKLIEVSTKKEDEKKKPKKIVKKVPVKKSWEAPVQKQETSSKIPESSKKTEISNKPKIPQIKTPAISLIEAPKDNTNVTSRTFYESPKKNINLNETLTRIENENLTPKEKLRKNINKLRKRWNSIRKEITTNVWTFREWHNWDYKFEFYDKAWDLPSHINILGENYKYTVDWDNLNWLGFESYYGWHSLRIWEYTDWSLSFWTVYSYDWLRETWSFNITWDLIEWVRIETDWSLHIIENSIETNDKNLLSF